MSERSLNDDCTRLDGRETSTDGSHQDTGVSEEPAGECEQCGQEVTLREAKIETYPGVEGRIALLFCQECARR